LYPKSNVPDCFPGPDGEPSQPVAPEGPDRLVPLSGIVLTQDEGAINSRLSISLGAKGAQLGIDYLEYGALQSLLEDDLPPGWIAGFDIATKELCARISPEGTPWTLAAVAHSTNTLATSYTKSGRSTIMKIRSAQNGAPLLPDVPLCTRFLPLGVPTFTPLQDSLKGTIEVFASLDLLEIPADRDDPGLVRGPGMSRPRSFGDMIESSMRMALIEIRTRLKNNDRHNDGYLRLGSLGYEMKPAQ